MDADLTAHSANEPDMQLVDLFPSRHRQPSIPGARQLHRDAVEKSNLVACWIHGIVRTNDAADTVAAGLLPSRKGYRRGQQGIRRVGP